MAFTLETGSGVEGANGYISQQFLIDHHTDRLGPANIPAQMRSEGEALIVRASDYIDQRFGTQFVGWRKSRRQGLEWPRIDAFDQDGFLFPNIPPQLQRACAEYCFVMTVVGVLAPIPAVNFPVQNADGSITNQAQGAVVGQRDKVGPIETETKYADVTRSEIKTPGGAMADSMSDALRQYPQADLWMKELLRSKFVKKVRRGG